MTSSPYANLEMTITPSVEGFALTLCLTGSVRNVRHGPFAMTLDSKELLASWPDPVAYGATLRTAIFVGEAEIAFRECYAATTGSGQKLRVQLLLPRNLQSLYWETLLSPSSNRPIACEGDLLLSRYLSGDGYRPVQLRPKGKIRALIAVAAPINVASYRLAEITAEAETAHVVSALECVSHRSLGTAGGQLATWDCLSDNLREGCDILYLVAHGKLINGQSWLYLVDAENRVALQSGTMLVDLLRSLDERRPRLVVLSSCEGAGDGYSDVLSSLGPLLAQAGVPSVLAMQGSFSIATNQRFVPIFFRELLRDGAIDRAVNGARHAVQNYPDWWMPVLYTSLTQGVLWTEDAQELPALSAQTNHLPGSQQMPNMSPSSPPPAGEATSSAHRTTSQPAIHFANRKEEIQKIMELADLRIERPVYVSAPSGFGKSALLQEVSTRFFDKNYDCALVKVDRHTNIYQIVDKLSTQLGLQADVSEEYTPVRMAPGELFISRWKKRYKEMSIEKKHLPGLVILVDFDDIPAKHLTDVFTGSFIKDCWDNLKNLQDPPHVFLIMAGRAIETLGLPNNPEPIVLTPFTYESVKETAQMYLPEQKKADVAKAASHVLYLTGGHPGCMAELLKQFDKQGLLPDRYFVPEQGNHLWDTVIRFAADDFEREIKEKLPNLHHVVEALCVFRYVDYDILQKHCDIYKPQGCADGEQLADRLTQSYLFTGGAYLSDGIGRQLVMLKLRYEHPDHLRTLCSSAADMCLQQIREGTGSSMWALEYLFQRLQAMTTAHLERADDRSEAMVAYLHTEVPLVVKAIYEIRPRWPNFRDLIQLIDEKLGDERSSQYGFWEFIFLFNYLFRAEEYDNTPIKVLRNALLAERDHYNPATMNKG